MSPSSISCKTPSAARSRRSARDYGQIASDSPRYPQPSKPALDQLTSAAAETALDMSTDAVFFFTTNLRIVAANSTAIAATGYQQNQLQTMRMDDLLADGALGNDLDPFHAAVERLHDGTIGQTVATTTLRTQSGVATSVEIFLRVVANQEDLLYVALVRSGGDDRSSEPIDNPCDHLTSLPTRAAWDRRLRCAENRAREDGAKYAVMFIDVDQFKGINDQNGHRAGDRVLQIVAERLRACVRPTDVVARYGGDEFVVLLENVCVDSEVEQIANRIRAELDLSIDFDGTCVAMAASVGVAIARPQSNAQDLVDEADQAMYRAKAAKRRSA
jgi:diguanylate cyclase (GGDEF)-like protein/PAS domain S-box-containing protein